MDNNYNNGNSQSWTDPITGETYPSENPHASIRKSTVPRPGNTQMSGSTFPQEQDIMPQVKQAQPAKPAQQAQPVRTQYGRQAVIPSNVTKFCEHCGSVIAKEAVICPTCGCQVALLRQEQPQQPIIINNSNINNLAGGHITHGNPKDKWTSFFLCLFLGCMGAHRFYEGKTGSGVLYFFTGGLFGIGWIVDIIRIACSSNPYYV